MDVRLSNIRAKTGKKCNISSENDLQQNLEKKLFSLKYDSGLKYGDFIKSLQFTKRGISMHLKTSGASFTIN